MGIKLDSTVSIAGTHRIGTLSIAPSKLRKALGPPNAEGDGYKVDVEYHFTDNHGNVFTLYAYKATSLYDDDLPNPAQFWRQRKPADFSIGGTGPVSELVLLNYINRLIDGE